MGRRINFLILFLSLFLLGCEKEIDTTSYKTEQIQSHKEFWIKTDVPAKLEVKIYQNGALTFTQLYSGGNWQKLNFIGFNNGYAVVKVYKGFNPTKKLEVKDHEPSFIPNNPGVSEFREFEYSTYGNQFTVPLIVF